MNRTTLYFFMLFMTLGGFCISCSSEEDEPQDNNSEYTNYIGYWYNEGEECAIEIQSEKDYLISKGESSDDYNNQNLVYRLWTINETNGTVIVNWINLLANSIDMPYVNRNITQGTYSLKISGNILVLENTENSSKRLYFSRINKSYFDQLTNASGSGTPSKTFPPEVEDIQKIVECSARYSNYRFEFTLKHSLDNMYPSHKISYTFAFGEYGEDEVYVPRWEEGSLIEDLGRITINADNGVQTVTISFPFFIYYDWRSLTADYFYDEERWDKKFEEARKYWTSYRALENKPKSDWSDVDKSLFKSVCDYLTKFQKEVTYDFGVRPVIKIDEYSYCIREYRLRSLINNN